MSDHPPEILRRILLAVSEPEEVIESTKNAALKRVRAALRGKEPGIMVLEGRRLVEDAVRAGVALELVVAEQRAAAAAPPGARVAKDGLLDALGGVRTSSGLVALAQVPERRGAEELAALLARGGAIRLLVVAGVADPGNLGALARAAEAFGCAALVVLDGGARPFGARALRGSMGSLLRLPVFETNGARALVDVLEAARVASFAASTRGGESLDRVEFPGREALWITGETGAGTDAVEDRLRGVTIPMDGAVESLNAAVAGALFLHEMARQARSADR